MSKNTEKFLEALNGKKVPLLTLDNKWYKLFRRVEKTSEIDNLEEQLKSLVMEQAHLNDEMKKLVALKQKLMDEIVTVMDAQGKGAAKKKEENSRLIDEIKEKIAENDDRAMELPRETDQTNKKLMVATMEQCYEVISENTKDIEVLDKSITELRIELKKQVVEKQAMEIANVEMYSYMHDIFGPAVIDLFDISYDIEGRKQEILEKQRAIREKKEAEKKADASNNEGD